MKKFVFILLQFQILFAFFKYSFSIHKSLDFPPFDHTHDSNLYIYVPIDPMKVYENSIDIYDENANLLDRRNLKDLRKAIGISWDDSAFLLLIKHVKDNIFILPIVRNQKNIQDDMVSLYIIFMDDYFNIMYVKFFYMLNFNIAYLERNYLIYKCHQKSKVQFLNL